jgi:hypothetical protein
MIYKDLDLSYLGVFAIWSNNLGVYKSRPPNSLS